MPGKDTLDEKQVLFLSLYLDPKSKTFSNAYQSAIAAGYTDSYAHSLCSENPKWFSEAVDRRMRILEKAEARLEKLVESEDERVAADITKHVTKTLGKKFYSEHIDVEHSGSINIEISKEIAEKNGLNDSNPSSSDNSEGQAQI